LQDDNRTTILEWFKLIDQRLAIIPPMEELVHRDEEIEALIARRNEARRNRDYATSDKIRLELQERGVVIEDTPGGTRWRRK
jgi:cysteinyl-tRNA synthetase